MFDAIKKILSKGDTLDTSTGEKIIDPHIALCVLLLEAAHSDGECSGEEKAHLVATLSKGYGVEQKDIEDLISDSDAARKEAVDLFRFTRHMNNSLNKEEKIEVMEAVWRILLVDDSLEAHEDHFAHKLANLLRLTHTELIDAKQKARTQLASDTHLS